LNELPRGEQVETDEETYLLRLYVTGTTRRSTRAIANLRCVCEERLPGRYALEVIDIYQEPEAARDDQVVCAPTLVRLRPRPVRRIIGDLSDRVRVLRGLDLPGLNGEGSRDRLGPSSGEDE